MRNTNTITVAMYAKIVWVHSLHVLIAEECLMQTILKMAMQEMDFAQIVHQITK